MYRFLVTPRWVGFHLLCIAAIVGMVNLGFWQLRRLDEKRALNAQVEAVADLAPAPYADVLGPGTDLAAIEYRKVEVTGTYVEREFQLVNVSQGGRSGHDQVAALTLDDGTLLIVNRGFAPGMVALPALPDDDVTLVGRVRRSRSASAVQIADDGSQTLTEIRRVDLDVLSTQFDQALQPVFLEALTEDGTSIPGLEPIAFPSLNEGPHLSYAIQWFFFSFAVVVGWVIVVRNTAAAHAEAAGRRPKRKKALIPEQYL